MSSNTFFDAKRKRILQAAVDEFIQYGYHKSSLDGIATRAGIGKGTVYYYFRSKEELFLEAVEHSSDQFFAMLEKHLTEQSTFEDKMAEFIRMPVRIVLENMPIIIEAIKALSVEYQQKLDEFRVRNRGRMYDLLRRILNYGKEVGVLREDLDEERFSQVINDWFLLADTNFVISDKERILARIERDYELIIQMILFGIIKKDIHT